MTTTIHWSAEMTSTLRWSAPGAVMIWYATCLHLTWAALVLVSPDTIGSTPVAAIAQYVQTWLLAVVLVAVAGSATLGLHTRPGRLSFLLLVPQQTILLISATGAVAAVVRGMYADGVFRPHLFILGDQLPIILAAPLYTLAIFQAQGILRRWTA